MKVSENLNNMNKYKLNMRILIGMIAILLIMTTLYMVFADSNVVPAIREMDGVPYMYFELEHSLSNAQYKYYGYGYTISVYEPGPNGALLATKYIQNAQFKPYMDGSTEKVWIPMHEIYGMVNLDDEFYSVRNMKVYLNGRLGIKVNGKLTYLYDSHEGEPENGLKETGLQTGYWKEDGITVPLNKDGQGIANGIKYVYGVSWTPITYTNLRQHFGIPLTVPAIYKYDRYRVEYREISSKKTVSSGKPYQNFNDFATITEHPVLVNGYEYAGQYMIKKIDTDNNEVTTDPYGDTQEGESATINIKKNADRYIITFYYTKVDPSSIGKPVTVNIEYREDTFDGKKLLNSTTTIGGDLSQFNFNSAKIDNYNCIGYYAIGQSSEYFHDTNVSFIIGKENYSKPVNGSLKIIFIYEKIPYISIPKCSPTVYGDSDTVNISMKKKDFENAADISVNNAVFKIDDFSAGKDKDGKLVDGTHEFKYFDLYVDKYAFSYDNKSKQIIQSFIVPKSIFTQSSTNLNLYTTNIDVTYAAFCSCFDGKPDSNRNYGMAIDKGNISVNITLIENKPPIAYFTYYTEKKLLDGSKREISKAFKGYETIINNQASDPNGLFDINYIKYTLKDSKGNEYFAKLLLLQDGSYMLEEDNIQANNIEMLGASENGDIKVKFKENETWVVSQYVQDLEGLNDTYTTSIVVEELNLKPVAILKDTPLYRYPRENAFNGKQNRVVQFNSNSSYVCDYLKGTGVTINHNRDCWEIIPLDGQSFDSIKFEYDINSQIVDGVLQVKYTSLNNIKMMFKEKGRYKFRLQVSDTDGNISEWAEQILAINEDLKPTVTSTLNTKYYRDAKKNAYMVFNALVVSNDYDIVKINNIGYKFDSNNDGNFTNEILQTSNLTYKDINIEGIIYKQITLISNMVGKYQFLINAKEEFGQETLYKDIDDSDYKTANIEISTEVDNIAPIASLGLQKNNNINVKIFTSGLTGTKNADIQSNLGNLKSWLESKNNIKVGKIETINLANEVNGLLAENALTWKKVTFNGRANKYNDDLSFKYTDKPEIANLPWDANIDPEMPLAGYWFTLLPSGTYAEGWNGIPVPLHYVGQNVGGYTELTNIKYKHLTQQSGARFSLIAKNMFDLKYYPNRVMMGNLNGGNSIWGDVFADANMFSAITEKTIKDFDISFTFNITPWQYADANEVGNPMFMWNVKDKNNYFAYVEFYEKRSYLPTGEIIQVKNGVATVLKTFYYIYDSRDDNDVYINVARIKQVGDKIQAFSMNGTLIFDYKTSNSEVGGHFGLSAYREYMMDDLSLYISSLKYIEDSNIYSSIDKFQWDNNTDKYIINFVEGTKLEELNNTYSFNRTLAELQEKNICLINIGVNSVNGSKLKSLVSRNSNNGTFIELGNIYDNLISSSNYISSKYNGSSNISQYVLLGESINNTENYYDIENDSKLLSEFKYNHVFNYFDNGLGVISNNNSWLSEPIVTFNKTGKYNLNYRTKDNPLEPDTNELNTFNGYRKYSEIYSNDIYIHRKPISSFTLGLIGTSAWTKVTLNEDFQDSTFNVQPTGGYWDTREAWYIDSNTTTTVPLSIPENAIDVKLSFRADRANKGYASITIGSIGVNEPFWYGGSALNYYLNSENTTLTIKASSNANIILDNIELTYSIPNETVSIPIVDYSYDTDHTSRTDKGLTEWQWRIIDKNGNISTQTFTNKDTGISWVRSNLQTNGKWVDCSVQLRVKDMENTWSDWSGKFIDGKSSVDGGDTSSATTKPIADFLIDKNPLRLNSEIQILTDISYDKDGYTLSNIWNVYKDGKFLFMNTLKDINSQLNKAINENGVGVYEIRLQVINSKNVYSDIVAKDFEVIVYNEKPLVDFNLVSNQNPIWVFPKALGLYTLKYRPSNTLFYEEYARFDTYAHDPNNDNLGFIYNWKLERFAVKNTSDISGVATNIYNYTSQFPFVNSFKNQGLNWGAYKITFKVTDIPPIPPYKSTDSKSAEITKYYYIVPEISLNGSFESSKADIMVGDTIKLKSTTTKLVDSVNCTLAGTTYYLSKSSEDGNFIYWEKEIVIPESITESGTYNLSFIGKTTYGGNGNVTREVKDNVPIDIIALKLINFRITNIVNHTDITFPYTKDMLINNLIPYKTGYYVTFQIDSKGKPDSVYGRIDIGNNGGTDQVINMIKVVTGDTETWKGRFYSSAYLPVNTVISIKLDCSKGSVTYDYNEKENWDGRSLIVNGTVFQDARINLTR